MFVALGIQHAMRMRHIVIFVFPGSTIFFHILINGTIFEKKLLNLKFVVIFFTNFSETFLILRRIDQKYTWVFM